MVIHKVCDLLRDNGCTENVISLKVVKALQLKTNPYPQPYKINWVKKGIKIPITKMCKVSFSIRKHYSCEALCDVIDMEVCHIILGRPWQFEEGAWFNGRANAYIVEWKGKKLWLISNENNPSKSEVDKLAFLLALEVELMQDYKEGVVMFAIFIFEKRTTIDPIPETVQHLLDQFQDIILAELLE